MAPSGLSLPPRQLLTKGTQDELTGRHLPRLPSCPWGLGNTVWVSWPSLIQKTQELLSKPVLGVPPTHIKHREGLHHSGALTNDTAPCTHHGSKSPSQRGWTAISSTEEGKKVIKGFALKEPKTPAKPYSLSRAKMRSECGPVPWLSGHTTLSHT